LKNQKEKRMSQEETKKDSSPNESALDSLEENLKPEEVTTNSSTPENSQEIENLPIESIGSYARLEELLTDEEKDNTSNPKARS